MAGYSLSSSKCALALSSTCVRANYISNKEETTWLHQHKNPFTFFVVAALALASGRMSELTDCTSQSLFRAPSRIRRPSATTSGHSLSGKPRASHFPKRTLKRSPRGEAPKLCHLAGRSLARPGKRAVEQ